MLNIMKTLVSCSLLGIILVNGMTEQVVEFSTTPTPDTQVERQLAVQSPMDRARVFASANGLTDCVISDFAFEHGSDVVLAIPTDTMNRPTSVDIVQITLDDALASGGIRRNLLGCSFK